MKGYTKDNVNFMNTTENKLTHFDAEGNAVMVDVSGKPVTSREATAHGIITMNEDAFAAVQNGTVKKGDVLGVARVAGIMATKRTSELIPLCHPLPLTKVQIEFELLPERRAGGPLHRQDQRRHRRGDGGPDRCFHRAADHLRYVQGRG